MSDPSAVSVYTLKKKKKKQRHIEKLLRSMSQYFWAL